MKEICLQNSCASRLAHITIILKLHFNLSHRNYVKFNLKRAREEGNKYFGVTTPGPFPTAGTIASLMSPQPSPAQGRLVMASPRLPYVYTFEPSLDQKRGSSRVTSSKNPPTVPSPRSSPTKEAPLESAARSSRPGPTDASLRSILATTLAVQYLINATFSNKLASTPTGCQRSPTGTSQAPTKRQ